MNIPDLIIEPLKTFGKCCSRGRIIGAILLILLIGVVFTDLSADPSAGRHWKLVEKLTDEFNGNQLDISKWWDHDPFWPGYKMITGFRLENTEIKDGKAVLWLKKEDWNGYSVSIR